MTKKGEEKIIRQYKTTLIGFPIVIYNVKMKKIMGEWCPMINWNALEISALSALIRKRTHLTGNQVRFIRLHFGLTLEKFGKEFGVSPQAVKKWESSENQPTNTCLSTERNIRYFIVNSFYSTQIKTLKKHKTMVDFIFSHTFSGSTKYITFDSKDVKIA